MRRAPARLAGLALLAVALVVLAWAKRPAPAADATGPAPLVRAVGGVAITVGDMDRALDFYTRVLRFERLSDTTVAGPAWDALLAHAGLRQRVVRLRLGEEILELVEYPGARGRPVPPDSRSQDRWFQHIAIIVSDMDEAYEWLRRHRVEHVSPAPQRLPDWNPNAGGIRAFYFKDPEGHVLEVLAFPPDKGDPRWQRKDRIFLGIDHTALVVADTETSLRFYRDALGLRVVGRSENWGPEQERLNNVAGARLRITALRAGAGPGIEFLEYLAPRDGRPAPIDLGVTDLARWQTILITRDAPSAARVREVVGGRPVSPRLASFADRPLGFAAGAMLRDPDGHPLQVRAD